MERNRPVSEVTSFTPEQKAFIREIAFEIMPMAIESHINSCPWGKKVTRFIWIGIGIGFSLTLIGATTVGELVKLIK